MEEKIFTSTAMVLPRQWKQCNFTTISHHHGSTAALTADDLADCYAFITLSILGHHSCMLLGRLDITRIFSKWLDKKQIRKKLEVPQI